MTMLLQESTPSMHLHLLITLDDGEDIKEEVDKMEIRIACQTTYKYARCNSFYGQTKTLISIWKQRGWFL